MDSSKQTEKSMWKRLWLFFCTKMPAVSLAVIGVCWLIYLAPKDNRNLNAKSHGYWILMGVLTWLCIIFGAVFIFSLIAYLIHKPLSAQRKGLHILLRILIAALAIPAISFIVWLSLFIFSAAGY